MKRWTALFLVLLLVLGILPTAWASEVTPTPPEWVKAEEYLVFEDDDVYTGETWDAILRLRADAAKGNLEPQKGSPRYDDWLLGEKYKAPAALRFELGLIGMKYAENSGTQRKAGQARRYFSLAQDSYLDAGGIWTDDTYNLITLWYQRAKRLECRPGISMTFSGLKLQEFLERSGYTMARFRDCSALKAVTEAEWTAMADGIEAEKAAAALKASQASVTLDGNWVNTENLARVVNGRTMIPVRCLAEQLGADVSYDRVLKAARIKRAGVEIIMPIGSKTCTVNGKPFPMDIAPYIENGRTMIPARYVSELFGQTIQWVPEGRIAAVTENKSLAGDTNLEPWAMAMGAYLNAVNNSGRPTVFGSKGRGLSYDRGILGDHAAVGSLYAYEWARYILANSWGITDRDSLIDTITRMTAGGHNADFLRDAAMIGSMSAAQYRQVLSAAEGADVYMFPYTKELSEKWGDRGILCWDLFRMSNLAQWGYLAGYVTYPEALALTEPVADALRENFSSWDEAYENYLDGYNWWARENVLNKDVWTVTRGPYVKKLLQNYSELFDDSLFKAPIRGVPGLTAEQLLKSIL